MNSNPAVEMRTMGEIRSYIAVELLAYRRYMRSGRKGTEDLATRA